jgi:hypothetical protein
MSRGSTTGPLTTRNNNRLSLNPLPRKRPWRICTLRFHAITKSLFFEWRLCVCIYVNINGSLDSEQLNGFVTQIWYFRVYPLLSRCQVNTVFLAVKLSNLQTDCKMAIFSEWDWTILIKLRQFMRIIPFNEAPYTVFEGNKRTRRSKTSTLLTVGRIWIRSVFTNQQLPTKQEIRLVPKVVAASSPNVIN